MFIPNINLTKVNSVLKNSTMQYKVPAFRYIFAIENKKHYYHEYRKHKSSNAKRYFRVLHSFYS